jgi:hypothetical protein
LALTDRERGVFVSAGAKFGGNKFVARDALKALQNAAVRDVTAADLRFHHLQPSLRKAVRRVVPEIAPYVHEIMPVL